jgi:hypothetical protein
MVQLLLNAGAKGDVIGKTVFKRAIEFAEKNRHFAIAQLPSNEVRKNHRETSDRFITHTHLPCSLCSDILLYDLPAGVIF